jgi:hypothetical protein
MNAMTSTLEAPQNTRPALIWPTVIQPDKVFENARQVARYAATETTAEGGSLEFRNAVLDAFNKLQPERVEFQRDTVAIASDFGDSNAPGLFRELLTVPELPDDWRYSAAEQAEIEPLVIDALATLDRLDPALFRSISALVGSLIFARRAHFGGGSVSHLIGTIWLGPSPKWQSIDYAENILHEYTHQCLFLDEMVNSIFSETVPRMAEDDALVTSTILKRRRGYDKAFHSAYVAAVIMQMYARLGTSRPESASLDAALITASGLRERRQFLTPHGLELLTELEQLLDGLAGEVL